MKTLKPIPAGKPFALLALSLALTSCMKRPDGTDTPHAATGQVRTVAAAPVSSYAAARFAEQATFGVTPELVKEIQAKGFEKWIDDEFEKPVSLVDPLPIQVYDSQQFEPGRIATRYARTQLTTSFIAAPDQLRRRVSWSLSQFITTAINKIEPYGGLTYSNFLQRYALGNFGALIRGVTLSPSMGAFLDNYQNRPTSKECPWCSPNENYARELMQLFTLGTVRLNPDGTVMRDEAGRPIETYTQKDVEEMARALTGWSMQYNTERTNFHRYDGEMVEDPWSVAHDRGGKTLLGTAIPANLSASEELDHVAAILMQHPNIAPFVGLRLIQHLVTSDPSPAYVARISAVFNDNGKGVRGDMKAVVKAILLDPEARKGDVIGADGTGFGKMREPVLWYTGVLRGLGCTKPIMQGEDGWGPMESANQMPFDPASVFSYYAATDRAPGSNLLAPEQKLLNAAEFNFRFGLNGTSLQQAESGCNLGQFGQALNTSTDAFLDLVSDRYFRNAMPATLRKGMLDLAPTITGNNPNERAATLLIFALNSPYYGAMQ